MTVTIAHIEFDRAEYDADADVLYLHVGDPSRAVDYDETPEGHAVRLDRGGELVGLTLVHRRSWPARQELRSAVFDYIESFHNRERRHSTLGYLSPREFEEIYIEKDSEEETVKP